MTWDDLSYWTTGEWDVVQERLDDLDKKKRAYCPLRKNLFAALDATALSSTKVILLGQDPYPDREYATGLAFSIPKKCETLPPTLQMIFKEYENDLHLPTPASGDLSVWAERGVLLWNAFPTCEEGHSLSHMWDEWAYLTREILSTAAAQNGGVVIAALGSVARDFTRNAPEGCRVIETSHPSPRGNINSKTPFLGSRLFSTINDKLCELKKEIIDWRL